MTLVINEHCKEERSSDDHIMLDVFATRFCLATPDTLEDLHSIPGVRERVCLRMLVCPA